MTVFTMTTFTYILHYVVVVQSQHTVYTLTGSGGEDVGSVEYWIMIKLPMGQSARLHQVSTMYISSTRSTSSSLLMCTLPTINTTGSRFWVKPERIPF